MNEEKVKSIYYFGKIIMSTLYNEKNKSSSDLENLILNNITLNFTKDEFINEFFFSNDLFPCKPIEEFDNIDHFELLFFKDSYDAVVSQLNDFNTISNLKERVLEYKQLFKLKYE